MAFQFLNTKLEIPASRKLKVPRPRLLKLLGDRAINRTILVSAPAGYGKTSTIIDWSRVRQEPFAWISLDETDNDPIRFFGYLREALRRILPNLGELEDYLSSYPTLPLVTSLNSLLNELAAAKQSLFLVLDDYHTINSDEVHELMTYFIQHAAAGVNVIISTRQDPPFPLERWRVQGELLEVRQRDLCFSKEDVSILLNRIMNLDLSESDIATLTQKTEGWIAGLHMAALFLSESEDRSGSISGFSGNHSHIMNYLVREVILRQPEDTRAFLQESAILDELSGPLCNYVTGRTDSRELLKSLSANNQFIIPLDDQQQWFRYHHLFSDVLKNQLQQGEPDRIAKLYHRASQWYEENDFLDEAIKHAFKSGDQNRAVELIEVYATTALEEGERTTFRKWMGHLPEEQIEERPVLNLIHAWSIMNDKTRASDELFLRRLDRAEVIILEQGDSLHPGRVARPVSLSWLRDTITLLRAIFTFERGQPARLFLPGLEQQLKHTNVRLRGVMLFLMAHIQIRAMELDRALDTLDDTESLASSENSFYLATYATYLKAWICFQKGRLHQAFRICCRGAGSVEQSRKHSSDRLSFSLALQIIKAAVLIEWDRVEEAVAILNSALHSLKKTTEIGIIINGMICRIQAQMIMRDQFDTIKAMITDLSMMERYHPEVRELVQAMQMELSVLIGNPPLNIDNIRELEEELEGEPDYFERELSYYQNYDWRIASRLIRIRLYLKHCHESQDNPPAGLKERLLSFLEQQLDGTEKWGLARWSAEIMVTLAMVYELDDGKKAGLKNLERALDLATSEDSKRIFLETAPYLQRSLTGISEQGRYTEFIRDLFSKTGQPTAGAVSADRDLTLQPDLLSVREQEVLRLIAEGCSNQDISSALFISLNTVKTHIAHIYEKLEVNRRTKAVSRAKQLGMLE